MLRLVGLGERKLKLTLFNEENPSSPGGDASKNRPNALSTIQVVSEENEEDLHRFGFLRPQNVKFCEPTN